jgi:predicted Ser/Thr protein kinase
VSSEPDPLEELVAEYLEQRSHGPGLSAAAFAAAHAEHAASLERAIAAALEIEALLATTDEPLPDQIGAYRVQARLGRGGMGVVYAVERDGATYALKLLSPALADDGRALQRFQREARGLARLRHPGIVGVHETGAYQGVPFLVMDRAEGPTLAEIALPLEPRRAARIVADLADAVAAAHGAGILHRDLKPSNVVLRSGDRPLLLDFGLVAAEDEGTLTSRGALLGTPRYMAPEQAAGQPADARTDVYGLGLILHELLEGRPARRDGTREAVLSEARRGRVSTPGRNLPSPLRRIVACALAREPRRRPDGADALASDLERFLAGQPVHLAPPNALQEAADALRRHPGRALACVLGLAVLGALAWPALHELGRERATHAAARLADESRAALARGEPALAVALAVDSVRELATTGGDASAELPRLLALAQADDATLEALREHLEKHPDDGLVHFALAYAQDSGHHLEEAVAGYQRALESDAGLLRAHTNLAHLFAGAQLGACRACDEAFARSPGMLAPRDALQHLLDALELDRGASDWCVGRVVQTTLTLGTRAPEVKADRVVAGRLEALLEAVPPPGAAARGRLEEGLARLRGARGTDGR